MRSARCGLRASGPAPGGGRWPRASGRRRQVGCAGRSGRGGGEEGVWWGLGRESREMGDLEGAGVMGAEEEVALRGLAGGQEPRAAAKAGGWGATPGLGEPGLPEGPVGHASAGAGPFHARAARTQVALIQRGGCMDGAASLCDPAQREGCPVGWACWTPFPAGPHPQLPPRPAPRTPTPPSLWEAGLGSFGGCEFIERNRSRSPKPLI